MIKPTLIALLIAGAGITTTLPAVAAVWAQTAPPAVRVEAVPAPRNGYVWSPGYWNYAKGKHVWVAGTWVRQRRGATYEPAHWVEHDGRWELKKGTWSGGKDTGPSPYNGEPKEPKS